VAEAGAGLYVQEAGSGTSEAGRVVNATITFDLDRDVFVCPRCDRDDFCNIMHQISHTTAVPASTSGTGLSIEMTCEAHHHWTLSFTDHSGGQWLGIAPSVCMGAGCRYSDRDTGA